MNLSASELEGIRSGLLEVDAYPVHTAAGVRREDRYRSEATAAVVGEEQRRGMSAAARNEEQRRGMSAATRNEEQRHGMSAAARNEEQRHGMSAVVTHTDSFQLSRAMSPLISNDAMRHVK